MSTVAGQRGADRLIADHFCVAPGEIVVITADSATDAATVDAIAARVGAVGAVARVVQLAQLPFQGKLADPYVPETLGRMVAESDVWFDLTFPYLAGSHVHDSAMKAKRTRYLLIGDLKADGLDRLYASADLDRVFAVQDALDAVLADHVGADCHVTSRAGTDARFRLGPAQGRKSRHFRKPGTSTIMGSAIFFPADSSVEGEIVADAIFHEFYTPLAEPLRFSLAGPIRELTGGGEHATIARRALQRASGDGLGRVIHLTVGFHPAARYAGRSFIEDIRTSGANAIGLGTPWWEEGGGENHPDAVVTGQSLWVAGEQIVRDGVLINPPDLVHKNEQLGAAI